MADRTPRHAPQEFLATVATANDPDRTPTHAPVEQVVLNFLHSVAAVYVLIFTVIFLINKFIINCGCYMVFLGVAYNR